jgi:hypothetical protein
MKRRQTNKDRLRIMKKGGWAISLGGDQLTALRGDKGFHRLVALMRLANQIRFVNMAALLTDMNDSPVDRRQMNQSFFFSCALLFEGWALAQRLGQHYRNRPSFQNGFAKLLRDPEAQAFVPRSLKALRNQAMFHPGEDEIGRCLAEVVNEREVVTSGVKKWAGYTYYDLADNLMFPTLVGPCQSAAEFEARLKKALKIAGGLLTRYLRAADVLIADVVLNNRPKVLAIALPSPWPSEGSALERAEKRARRLP